jgi:hypothetical protein
MASNSSENWEKIAEDAAKEIRVTPQPVSYVEARGYLCHELLCLLGGQIQFVETPWKNVLLKIFELVLPIAPVCRWYPPQDCELELVGYRSQSDLKVYRLTPKQGPITVFFVEYRPESPAAGHYIRTLFNTPRLDIRRFLRPPFDGENDNLKIERLLRDGSVERFAPVPMTTGARDRVEKVHLETCRGLWQVLSR